MSKQSWTSATVAGSLNLTGALAPSIDMQNVTAEYLLGIKEGRECLDLHGVTEITVAERTENLRSTLRGFSRDSPVGQMLRGELDFWRNQSKRATK